jgi:hypothetical protein
MNKTTGALFTHPSIAARVSVDRNERWRAANLGERSGLRRGLKTEALDALAMMKHRWLVETEDKYRCY